MWGYDCVIVPIIVGGLGAVTHKLKDYLALIPGCPNITMCQKITLLGSKKILMDVLSGAGSTTDCFSRKSSNSDIDAEA